MWNQLLANIVAMASMASAIAVDNLPERAVSLHDSTLHKRQSPSPGVFSADVFLRRAFHSSIIVDKYLYIHGGQFSFKNSTGNPSYGYATSILSLDMSKDWKNDTVVLTPSDVPDYVIPSTGGALWYHEPQKLIFTGLGNEDKSFSGNGNIAAHINSFQPDGSGAGTWAKVIQVGDSRLKDIKQPEDSSQASGLNVGVSLNGGTRESFFPGTLTFHMDSKTFNNDTAAPAGRPFWRGRMHYVPVYAERGIMINFGGITSLKDNPLFLKNFTTLSVYNPYGQKWYNQTTTGNAPNGRVAHCVAGAPSDKETWEIFVYGGYDTRPGTAAIPYDTIHILTLPAFHWIAVPYNPQNPRHGHTCHGVGGSQILVIGGADANPKVTTGSDEDINRSRFETPDPLFKQGLGIFDLTTLSWKDKYSAKPPAYTWSEPIKSFYEQTGGPPSAQASKLTPDLADLFKTPDFTRAPPGLSLLFSKTSPSPSSTPSATPSSSTGAIAGGAVGGVVVLGILGAGIWWILRRRRRRHNYAQAEGNSLEDMYKSGSKSGSGSYPPGMNGAESYGDAPPQYVLKDGTWQWEERPAEVDAVENQRSNLFEADGRERESVDATGKSGDDDGALGVKRTGSQRPISELPS